MITTRKAFGAIGSLLAFCVHAPSAHGQIIPAQISQKVFDGGGEGPTGTSNYRIPSITVAPNGDLLAFAEARRSSADPGAAGNPIDMAMKRSTDGGQTWIDYTVMHSNSAFDYSDPRAVVDANTGTVHLLYTQWPDACGQSCVGPGLGSDSSQTFHQFSNDNGLTWSGPINITAQVKDPTWESLNTGPGIAIQLHYQDATPSRNGRLIFSALRRDGSGTGENVSIYSDDGGATWQTGDPVPTGSSEAELVELTNGDLLWDRRRNGLNRRAISTDGGLTWGTTYLGDINVTAVDPALLRYSAVRDGNDRDRILFSGPLGSPPGAGDDRTNMGIWTSYDEGQTFINPVQVDAGHGAYSAMQRLEDGSIGLLYESTGSTVIWYFNHAIDQFEGANHHPKLSHYDGFGNQVDSFRGGVGWSGSWDNSGVTVEPGDLAFPDFATTGDTERAHLRGDTMTRDLGLSTIDLNQNSSHYLSLFVNHDSADGTDSGSGEFLDILLQDGSGTTQASFGVGSNENFFLSELGGTVGSADGAAARDDTYLLLVKLESQDDQSGNFDRLSVAWYDDPSQVPGDEAQVNWQLEGETSENLSGTIEQITIAAGSNSDWLVDGLRIGKSFAAVMAIDPLLGDINQDGRVDHEDVDQFVVNWRTSGWQGEIQQLTHGDLNNDSFVNLADALILHRALEQNGLLVSLKSLVGTSVPEPASLTLFALSGFVVLTRYRSASRAIGYSQRHDA